jgi:hypothetical protein
VLVPDLRFALLNLMSDNPGMRWDIEETKKAIGYAPRDGHVPVVSEEMAEREEMVRLERELADQLDRLAMMQRW